MKLAGLAFAIALALSSTVSTSALANDLWTNLFNERMAQAKQGSMDAQFEVAAMYENGRGVGLDRAAAVEWYNKAAAQGHSRAAGAVARIQDNERRFAKTQKQAEIGDIEAQYSLGTMYLTGTGVTLDLGSAQLWLSRAAARGHTKAQFKLGHLYYVALGDRVDYKAAYEWFSKAADSGYAHAMYYLGEMHSYGAGVKKDYAKAREWYGKASAAGFSLADKSIRELDEHIAAEKQQLAEAEAARKAAASASAVAATTAAAAPAPTPAKKAVTPPPAPKPALPPRERLLQTQWHDGTSHAKFLPSQISQCKASSSEVVCYSKELARQNAPLEHYRVKSIIRNFNPNGTFHVVYRELVLPTVSIDEAEEAPTENSEDTQAKTGWLEPHKMNCKFGDDSTLSCTIEDGSTAEFKGV